MTPLRTILAVGLSLLAGWLSSARAAESSPAAGDNQRVLDAFLAAEKLNESFSADQRQKAEEMVAALRADPDGQSIAITEALRELYPEYRDALAALGEENLGAAIVSLDKLRSANDPYLAADAGYFLARAYMLDERFEDSLPLLGDVTDAGPAKRSAMARRCSCSASPRFNC